MTAHFAEVHPHHGFDKDTTPMWQMVPVARFKHVKLVHGHHLHVVSTDKSVATVHKIGGTYEIKGVRAGTAFLEAKDTGGSVKARLEVEVVSRLSVATAFLFVSDKAGHKTTRHRSIVDGLLETLNHVYVRQSNIHFSKAKVADVKVMKDLGLVVGTKLNPRGSALKWDTTTEWNDVIAHDDPAARFNVFFVWEYEESQTPYTDVADAATELGGKHCLFEDHAGTNLGESLSHEAGHALGLDDTYATTDKPLLMYGITDARGRRLRKADILTARAKV